MATQPDPLAILVSRLAQGIPMSVVPASQATWRVMRRQGDQWIAVRPAHPGFSDPGQAIVDADARITEFLGSRDEAVAVEVLRLYKLNRLDRRATTDAEGNPVVQYRGRLRDGTFTAWLATPEDATLNVRAGGG